MNETLIIGNSLETFLLNYALAGETGQSPRTVCPRAFAGSIPLLGHRVVRSTPFMKDVLEDMGVDYDSEFFFESGVLRGKRGAGVFEPLADEPQPHLSFDEQQLMNELVEFASPELYDNAKLEVLNWDRDNQEADVCLEFFNKGKSEFKVFEFDSCVLDASLEGSAVPNKSFRDEFRIVRIQNPIFKRVTAAEARKFDIIHVDRELGSPIDRFHTQGEFVTAFVRASEITLSEIQDALEQFFVDPKIYDWNNKPVSLPHLLSVCKNKSPHFTPWSVANLSEVEQIVQEICA